MILNNFLLKVDGSDVEDMANLSLLGVFMVILL
jgi:hypothetical protein